MNEYEIEKTVQRIIDLSIQRKQINKEINKLKKELMVHIEAENMNEGCWSGDNGRIELETKTRYKLADIPAEVKVSSEICAIDTAEKAFKTQIKLTKEGKKMFYDGNPSLVKLMIPKISKSLKIVI